MNKNYIAPSVEIIEVKMLNMISASIQSGNDGGSHDASSKLINFAEDNADVFGEN